MNKINKMSKRKKNPFKISYFGLAIICFIALYVVFSYVNYRSMIETKIQYDNKKLEMLMDDWENQLVLFEKLALKVAINNVYQPFYFKRNKYK